MTKKDIIIFMFREKIFYFNLLCGWFLCMYVRIQHVCLMFLQELKGARVPETRVADSCVLLFWYWFFLKNIKGSEQLSHFSEPKGLFSLCVYVWVCVYAYHMYAVV